MTVTSKVFWADADAEAHKTSMLVSSFLFIVIYVLCYVNASVMHDSVAADCWASTALNIFCKFSHFCVLCKRNPNNHHKCLIFLAVVLEYTIFFSIFADINYIACG